MPKVSVIITAYNLMAYLPETIANVLQQTYTDFEVVVVNDGSTDNTAEWVSQVEDPRVRLISQSNMGLSAACNTGIEKATGEYITFLDADDLWSKTKLAQQVAILDNNPEVSVVYNWVTYMNEARESTGRIVKPTAEGYIWQQMIEVNQIECGSVIMLGRSCQAREFQQVALTKHPARYWTKENLRLTVAIFLTKWFGRQNYLRFLGAMQSLPSKLNPASVIGNQ